VPVLQPDAVKVDPAPGHVLVTPPMAPGAFAAAVQAAARTRAQQAPSRSRGGARRYVRIRP